MKEEIIEKAKCDFRVNYDYVIYDKIHVFSAIPSNLNSIVIYCHGLGSNRLWASRFYDELFKKNIGIISFDFPGHGDDKASFKDFTLQLCITYLDSVINYAKDNYNAPIYLFGSSFGGYVILNKLINSNKSICKTILMCPAINFCQIVEKKTGVCIEYFTKNEFLPLYNNIKFYKKTYLDFKSADYEIKKSKFNNIAIIQGMLDSTVDYNIIENFCNINSLNLYKIERGKHELYDYNKKLTDILIDEIIYKE